MAASRTLLFAILFIFFHVDVHAFRNAGDKSEYSVAGELETVDGVQHQSSPQLREAVVGPEGPQDGPERSGVLAAAAEGHGLLLAPDAAPLASESDGDDSDADTQVHAVRPPPASVASSAPAVDLNAFQLLEKSSRVWVHRFHGFELRQMQTNHQVAAGLGLLVAACGCLLCLCPAKASERRGSDAAPGPQVLRKRGRARTRESLFDDVLKEVAGSPRSDQGGSRRGSGASQAEALGHLLSEIHALASQLKTTAGKFPKSGRGGLFSGRRMQQRFVVVSPHPDPSSGHSSPESELKLWRRGQLGWWETEAAYMQRSVAKGTIPLHKIVDVHASKTPKTVVVSHQDSDQKCWMELIFASDEAAETWSDAFRDLLAKLNGSTF